MQLTQFAPRMGGSLVLCLILVFLGLVKGISHTKSVKRICLLSQLSDVDFESSVRKKVLSLHSLQGLQSA